MKKHIWPGHDIHIGDRTFHGVQELSDYYYSQEFEDRYTYYGDDLGVRLVRDQRGTKTVFRLWSPTAQQVYLCLYATGHDSEPMARRIRTDLMEKDPDHPGVWKLEIPEDLSRTYYTYRITCGGTEKESADPYARAAGLNGLRSMVVDPQETDPDGWDKDSYVWRGTSSEAVIWETQVKDFSHCQDSGMDHKGKYGAIGQPGTRCGGLTTGVDHLKELGITHVHFLPLAENATVDEAGTSDGYNWGYDSLNYNVPEGSFSEDALHGEVRLRELKEAILRLHRQGIGVILDVVYNHTYHTEDSWFERVCPFYYHRTTKDGVFGNASGCGNETASERSMMRMYILDSVRYWAEEYHIDGFRFDLMGIHDTETMNQVRSLLNSLPGQKHYLLYGEPWAALPPSLPEGILPADRNHLAYLAQDIAIFNDEIRDGIKGSCFKKEEAGFANGGSWKEAAVGEGITASVRTDGAKMAMEVGLRQKAAAGRMVSYVSSHDNYTLWDKLTFTVETDGSGFNEPEMVRVAVNKLCAAIYLTSQGIAFMQSGEEFGRSKLGDGNSYRSAAEINDIRWSRKGTFRELYEYYRGLIAIRKKYSCFTDSGDRSAKALLFIEKKDRKIGYLIPGKKKGEPKQMLVLFNSSDEPARFELPEMAGRGTRAELMIGGSTVWHVLANESTACAEPFGELRGNDVTVFMRSALIAASEEKIGE